MPDVIPNVSNKWVGWATVIGTVIAVGTVVYYLHNQGTSKKFGGVKFNRLKQGNRDSTLGRASGPRKWFGYHGASSAQGAGAGVKLPNRTKGLTAVRTQGGGQSSTGNQGGGPASPNRTPWVSPDTGRYQRPAVGVAQPQSL